MKGIGVCRRRLPAIAVALLLAGCGSSSSSGPAGGGGAGPTHPQSINPCKLVDPSTAGRVLGATASLDATLNQDHVDHDSAPDGTAAIDSTCAYTAGGGEVMLTLVQPDHTSSSKQPMGIAGASQLLGTFKVFFPAGTSPVSGLGDEAYRATGTPSALFVGSPPGSATTEVFARDGDLLILAIVPGTASAAETQAEGLLRAAFTSADSGAANGPVQPGGSPGSSGSGSTGSSSATDSSSTGSTT